MTTPLNSMNLTELQMARDRIRNEMHALQPQSGARVVASQAWVAKYLLLETQAREVKHEFDRRDLGHLCPRFFWK